MNDLDHVEFVTALADQCDMTAFGKNVIVVERLDTQVVNIAVPVLDFDFGWLAA